MNFSATQMKFNPKYINNVSAWIDQGRINVEMYTKRVLRYGLHTNIETQIKIDNSHKYQTLYVQDVNTCKLLNDVFRETLVRIWFRNILKHGNLMENCPVPIVSF